MTEETTTVLEVQRWPSNAELIAAVMEMHVYARFPRPRVVDLTYGRGVWWKNLDTSRMETFVHHDARIDGVDFRNLPHADNSWDAVFFDPDYVAPGGRKTSTIDEFNDRYGLKGTYETPAQLQQTMNAGLREAARVCAPQGCVLMKCSSYVSSGKLWLGEYESIKAGLETGLQVADVIVDVGDPGPQPTDRKCSACSGGGLDEDAPAPPGRLIAECQRCAGTGRIVPRQQHARSNSSRLIVFKKPGRRVKNHG